MTRELMSDKTGPVSMGKSQTCLIDLGAHE